MERGKIIGSVSVALEFYRGRGQGSIPQPNQELPAVNPLPFHVPIIGSEVREARMHGGTFQGDVPGDGIVGGVRAIPEDVGEGRARGVHVQAVAEGSGHRVGSFVSIV
jgi:hypothetical protein